VRHMSYLKPQCLCLLNLYFLSTYIFIALHGGVNVDTVCYYCKKAKRSLFMGVYLQMRVALNKLIWFILGVFGVNFKGVVLL